MKIRTWISLLLLGSLFSWLSSAASFEYVSPAKGSELEALYSSASAPKPSDLGKPWICDLYGMRSRMQVERNLNLYKFSLLAPESAKNSGDHIVHNYKFEKDALVGNEKAYTDQIRLTKQGELIAEISSKQDPSKRVVVAYSHCKTP